MSKLYIMNPVFIISKISIIMQLKMVLTFDKILSLFSHNFINDRDNSSINLLQNLQNIILKIQFFIFHIEKNVSLIDGIIPR